MVPDVLVNILATVVTALAIVGVRSLRAQIDPDEEVPPHKWQALAAEVGSSSLVMLGMFYLFALALSGLGQLGENYVNRLATSLSASRNATEDQRHMVETLQDVVAKWGWAWSWPYVIGLFTTLYLGVVIVGIMSALLDENKGAMIIYTVVVVPATLVAAAGGGFAAYFGHLGLDALFRSVYAATRPQARAGQLDVYPADSLIQLSWPIAQSVVTIGGACGLAAFVWASWWVGRNAYRAHNAQPPLSQPGPAASQRMPISTGGTAIAMRERTSLSLTQTVQDALREAQRRTGRGAVQTGMVLVCLAQADARTLGWDRFWATAGYPDQGVLRNAKDGQAEGDAPFEFAPGETLVPSRDLAAALQAAGKRGLEPVVAGGMGLALLEVPTGAVARDLVRDEARAIALRESMENDVLGVDFPEH